MSCTLDLTRGTVGGGGVMIAIVRSTHLAASAKTLTLFYVGVSVQPYRSDGVKTPTREGLKLCSGFLHA
jgi:hypothetical protein